MSKWEMVRWSDVLTIRNGRNQKAVEDVNGKYPIYGSGGVMGYANDYLCAEDTVIIGRKGSINNPIYVAEKFWNVDTAFGLVPNSETLFPKYLYYFCFQYDFERLNTTVTIPSLTKSKLLEIEIPLPPLETQRKIAKTLDTVSEILAMRKQQLVELDNLIKSTFYDMFGDPVINEKGWAKKPLGESCSIITGNTPSRRVAENYGEYIEWIKSDNITESLYITPAKEYLSDIGFAKCRYVDNPTILMTCIAGSLNSIGNVAITDRKVAFNQQINAIIPDGYDLFFLYSMLQLSKGYIHSTINMSLKGILSKGKLSQLEFIIPPIEFQRQFGLRFNKIAEMKDTLTKASEQVQLLFDSLMSRYFE